MVGISYEQCELLCDWLTKKYNSDAKRKHKKVNFKIPTRDQWYYSTVANPAKKKMDGSKEIFPFLYFPWGGPYLQNRKGEWLANFRPMDQASVQRAKGKLKFDDKERTGDFYVGGAGYSGIGPNGFVNDNADVTAPVNSYWPNAAGIYNLAGNVEEYIREKGFTKGGSWNDTGYYLRNDVDEKYDSTNYVSSSRGFRFVMEVVEEK
jgi:formylglycine-generating enzyme required for sulfatase activity